MDCYNKLSNNKIDIKNKINVNSNAINPSNNTNDIKKKKKKKSKNKCFFCKTKLSLVNFECNECMNIFCIKCRFPEEHECIGFQNKIDKEKQKLDENNPLINFKKVIKF